MHPLHGEKYRCEMGKNNPHTMILSSELREYLSTTAILLLVSCWQQFAWVRRGPLKRVFLFRSVGFHLLTSCCSETRAASLKYVHPKQVTRFTAVGVALDYFPLFRNYAAVKVSLHRIQTENWPLITKMRIHYYRWQLFLHVS